MVPITLRVNQADHSIDGEPGATLLEILRDHLHLTGGKQACGRGECGACTVLVDGVPIMACITLALSVRGAVTTIEGLGDSGGLREAFAELGGFQCGFCTPGQIMHAAALLQERLPADLLERERMIRHRLSGNICRCTGYNGIVAAVMRVAARAEAAAP